MIIIFRADANQRTGMGHVMRCLAIADAFSTMGYGVTFVLADASVKFLVEQRGYSVVVIETDYSDMESELSAWDEKVNLSPEFVIVDSYYVTTAYFEELRKRLNPKTKLIYIDDMFAQAFLVDAIINYSIYADASRYKALYGASEIPVPELFLGIQYVPLRKEFRGLERKMQPPEIKDVMISTGGSDELHVSLAVIRHIIQRKTYRGYRLHFLLGALNSDREEILALIEDSDDIIIHEKVSDMKSLICGMDIIVSAAGSTTYEVCACGVPLVTYAIADNQLLGAEALEDNGLAVNLGDIREPGSIDPKLVISGILKPNVEEQILNAIDRLSDDYSQRCQMGTNMQCLIDGQGAERLARDILSTISE